MRRQSLLVAVSAVGVLALASPAFGALGPGEKILLKAINEARTAHHLKALEVDPTLQQAARAHSQDMLRRGYFDHGPFSARMHRYGVQGSVMGENIGWWTGYRWARKVVSMWLRSPEHRDILLRPGFRHIGIAAPAGSFSGSKVRMVTADFAGR